MIPRVRVTAMFRIRPARSPLRIDQTASWQVKELMIRRIVMIRGRVISLARWKCGLPSGGQTGAFARTLK